MFSGLVGAAIVYRPGELERHTLDVPAPAGSNLTEEVLTSFFIVDENRSYYIDEDTLNKTNITEGELQVNRLDPGFQESNLKHSINGRMFGNLFGLNLTVGRDARWHVVCIPSLTLCTGNQVDFRVLQQALGNVINVHTPHWHGNTLLWAEQRLDIVGLSPRGKRVRDVNFGDRST